jgi:spermidine synthase
VAEPGSTPAASEAAAGDPGATLFGFAVLLAAGWLAAAHELCLVQPSAYLDPGFGPPRWGATLAAAVGLGIGGLVGTRGSGRDRLPGALGIAALTVAGSAHLLFLSLSSERWFPAATHGLPALGGAALGALLVLSARALGRTLLALGAIERGLGAFRLLLIAAIAGLAAAAAARVGLLRTGAGIGLLLAGLCIASVPLLTELEQRPIARARSLRAFGAVALGAALGAFVLAEALVPAEEIGQFANRIVAAKNSERGDYRITSGQQSFELFADRRLVFSSLDERRYHEALVHPVLLSAPRRERVLLFAPGHGAELREILRHPEVSAITLVTPDAELVRFARRQVWLRRIHRGSLDSDKVTIVEKEPAAWLLEAVERFDVAIVDLPDPATYMDGKNYTRHFYRLLRERLEPDGMLVVQATSPFGSPRTFATIRRTLEAAGLRTLPYRAPVPTFGDWGFLLAAREPPRAPGEELDRWLSGATRQELFALPGDLAADAAGVSTLHDQVVVETFAAEQEKLGL